MNENLALAYVIQQVGTIEMKRNCRVRVNYEINVDTVALLLTATNRLSTFDVNRTYRVSIDACRMHVQ
jgi:hypothetical protein